MKRYLSAILKNETDDDHLGWVEACRKYANRVDYRIVDLTREDWLDRSLEEDFDVYLTRPPGSIGYFKQLYDERIYILTQMTGKIIYPSYEEILIYENKRMLAYWLSAHRIPHPRTWIFYHKTEADGFAADCSFPLVAKTAVGGGGSGVRIIRSREELQQYIDLGFSDRGIVRRGGPNWRKGEYFKRLMNRLRDIPGSFRYFRKKYAESRREPQKWYVILQEYVEADFEWRLVRIGDSFFGHKKLGSRGEMFSGTSRVDWQGPPAELLDFVQQVTDRRNFLCQAVDVFEPQPGRFLVNEMQCFWGSRNPHQMMIDGKPGRYVKKNSGWVFEEGAFNTNNSYDLRLQHVMQLLKDREGAPTRK